MRLVDYLDLSPEERAKFTHVWGPDQERIVLNAHAQQYAPKEGKMSKKARLDALETAYLSQRESFKKLRTLVSGLFDLVIACSENVERLDKELKAQLNTNANLDGRIKQLEDRLSALEQQPDPQHELADMRISKWERDAAAGLWGDPPQELLDDIETVKAYNKELAEQTKWLTEHTPLGPATQEFIRQESGPIPGRYK